MSNVLKDVNTRYKEIDFGFGFGFGFSYDTFSGEGNGTPLQYSCLENPTDGGAW